MAFKIKRFIPASPLTMPDPKDPKDPKTTVPATPKAKEGEIPGIEEIQKRFEGQFKVTAKPGKTNEYTLTSESGGQVSYSAGRVPKKSKKEPTMADIINESIK